MKGVEDAVAANDRGVLVGQQWEGDVVPLRDAASRSTVSLLTA